MKLEKLMSMRSAIATMRGALLLTVIISGAIILITIYVSMTIIAQQKSIVYVIDPDQGIMVGKIAQEKVSTYFNYKIASKAVYELWYQFDENTYKKNKKNALVLFGNCGKALIKEDKDNEILKKIKGDNYRFAVFVEDVKIDMQQDPAQGYIKGVQTIISGGKYVKRRLDVTFILYPTDRSQKNPYGVKIDNWKIVNSDLIKEQSTAEVDNGNIEETSEDTEEEEQ